MTRCLRLLCTLLLIPTLQAGTIEVAQWMPWEFVKHGLIPEHVSSQIHENELELSLGQFKPKLMNLDVEIKGSVSQTVFNQNGISSKQQLEIKVAVGKMIIDQILERIVNGNIIRVRIKAECAPFEIQVHELDSSINLDYKFQDYWKPSLSDLSVHIPENAWSISEIHCSGIDGLGNEVASELQKNLRKPDAIYETLKNWLSEEVTERFDSAWNTLLNSSQNVTLSRMGKPSDKGILIYAHLPIKSSRNIVLPVTNESALSDVSAQLILSQEGFEALLEDKMLELIPKNYNLQEVKAFRDLMKSKVLQYFVWPDLNRFKSKTPFYLNFNPEETKLALKPINANQWTGYLNANGLIKTIVGDAEIDYIAFGIGVKAKLSVQVKDSKLILNSSESDVQMSWSYGLLYQLLFKPNKRISTDILKDSINQFFKNRSVTEDLPSIKFDDREWKLQNWKQEKDIITMEWL